MLLKTSPNEITRGETLKITFPHDHSTKSHIKYSRFKHFDRCRFFHYKDNTKLSFQTIPLKFKDFAPEIVFIMENKKNRRSRRIESQSSDKEFTR